MNTSRCDECGRARGADAERVVVSLDLPTEREAFESDASWDDVKRTFCKALDALRAAKRDAA